MSEVCRLSVRKGCGVAGRTEPGCVLAPVGPRIAAIESFVVSDLEIAKAMAAGGRLRLRACGWSMVPRLRNGDVLHVAPRTVREIAVGDVVVFRREGQFLAHRAIGKGVTGEGAYVVTRADQARQGDDGPSYDKDVLGVVAEVEKGRGRYLPRWVPAALARVQGLAVYRRAARSWLARRHASLFYAVYAPLHPGQRYDLYRKMSLAEFAALPLQPEPGGLDCWSLLVWIAKGPRPAATMEFTACPVPGEVPGWTITGSQVRRRFEGTGIDELLRAQAAKLLAGRKMTLLETVLA